MHPVIAHTSDLTDFCSPGAVPLAAVFLALAGCGGNVPMVQTGYGPNAVALDGVDYQAELRPLPAGENLSISRAAPSFGYDEGAVAKRVAVQFCKSRGQHLTPTALGQFQAGAWVFDGGCA